MTSPYERAHRRLMRYEVIEWVMMVAFVAVPAVGGMYTDGEDRINANYMALFSVGYLCRAVFRRGWRRDYD